MSIASITKVEGHAEVEKTEIKRTGRFLFIFPTEWWETVSTRTLGNDIHIVTNCQIRNVYLNGEKLYTPPNTY